MRCSSRKEVTENLIAETSCESGAWPVESSSLAHPRDLTLSASSINTTCHPSLAHRPLWHICSQSSKMKPVVGVMQAWSWYVALSFLHRALLRLISGKNHRLKLINSLYSIVLSVFAIVILSVIGALFKSNHHSMMGSTDDPKDGPAVATTVFSAVIVYIVRFMQTHPIYFSNGIHTSHGIPMSFSYGVASFPCSLERLVNPRPHHRSSSLAAVSKHSFTIATIDVVP